MFNLPSLSYGGQAFNAEGTCSFVPDGTLIFRIPRFPALKRWAIFRGIGLLLDTFASAKALGYYQ